MVGWGGGGRAGWGGGWRYVCMVVCVGGCDIRVKI